MPNPDYYKTLELDPKATDEQIWLSYHKFVYLYNKGKLDGGAGKYLMADRAYRVLMDRQTRQAYDRWYEALRRHQEAKSGLLKLLVAFFTAFSASGVAALFLSPSGNLALPSTAAYYIIFGILFVAIVLSKNKLKTNLL